MSNLNAKAVTDLRRHIEGEIHLPGANYAALCRVASHNPATQKEPAVVVRCLHGRDVAVALKVAREQGLEIAVRSGGHDVMAASVCDGGILIDTALMKSVRINVREQRASVGAGVLAGDLTAACDPHGLMPIVGVNPTVGVAGLTLGGGFGLFLGRHGASCDNLLEAEVVTPDGDIVRAAADGDADLLWALKGGGGNFGIATRLDLKLHAAPLVLGGVIAWRTDIAPFFEFYADAMRQAPDELTVEIAVFGLGKPIVAAIVCWCGEPEHGAEVLRPWRAYAKPLVDAVEPVTRAELEARSGLDYLFKRLGFGNLARSFAEKAARREDFSHWLGGSIQNMTPSAATAFAAAAQDATETWAIGLSHYLHGAACRVGMDASPLPRPERSFSYLFGCRWRDPARTRDAMDWLHAGMDRLRPHSSPLAYINFLSSDVATDVAAAYGSAYPRLRALKSRYDPGNVLRGNRNIAPAQ